MISITEACQSLMQCRLKGRMSWSFICGFHHFPLRRDFSGFSTFFLMLLGTVEDEEHCFLTVRFFADVFLKSGEPRLILAHKGLGFLLDALL